MSHLKFRCPASNVEVETSIETDDRTLQRMRTMKLSVWCPHCFKSHSVPMGSAYVDGSVYVDMAAALGVTALPA
jgi:hypothetical protein